MKQPNMSSTSSGLNTDVRRKGYLYKIKTAKKKFFVLRNETEVGPARLEYYDHEKKFQSGGVARRCIILKNCFSVNAKSDNPRFPHAIVLYTKDDCFAIGCESEAERHDWLKAMLDLRRPSYGTTSHARSSFKHTWPVQVVSSPAVKSTDAAVQPGDYHLIMTSTSISLLPVVPIAASVTSGQQKEIVLPLDDIQCCDHSGRSFWIELSPTCTVLTGCQELWMNAEDSVIAQSMSDTLVNLLNSFSTTREPFRARAHTSVNPLQRKTTYLADVSTTDSSRSSQLGRPTRSRFSASFLSRPTSVRREQLVPSSRSHHAENAPTADEYMVMSTPTDEGYLDMSAPRRLPDSESCSGSLSSGTTCCTKNCGTADMQTCCELGQQLEVVHSYVAQDDDDSSDECDEGRGPPDGEELPKRAYSVGSKPLSMAAGRCLTGQTASDQRVANTKQHPNSGMVEDESRSCVSARNSHIPLSLPQSDCVVASRSRLHAIKQEYGSTLVKDMQSVCGARSTASTTQSEIRPRTSTFPRDVICSQESFELSSQRPRSISNGNMRQMRDRINIYRCRARHANGLTVSFPLHGSFCTARSVNSLSNANRSLETSEYVEMGIGEVDYVDMTLGRRTTSIAMQQVNNN